jgi:glutamate synthase (NADPH/NADH) small chain
MDGLPARQEEIEHAKEEGIVFKVLRNPVAFLGSDYVTDHVKCEIMTLGEVDASGRRRPIGTNTFETIDVDHVIVAIGQSPNPILKRTTDTLEVDKYGRIVTSDYQTSIKGVFAGGDVVSGAATVILAMGAGKDAARAMDDYITSKTS